MKQTINEEVTVVIYYDARRKRVVPYRLYWHSREYTLGELDYYHSYMDGRDRQHIFELCDIDVTLWFRLRLDSSNLHWILEATHDGLAT